MKIKIHPFLVVLLVALVIRILHLNDINSSPLKNVLIGDEITHFSWGQHVLSGKLTQVTPFFRAPLYGFFLASVFKFSKDPVYAVRYVQLLLGLGCIFLVYLTGKKIFSGWTGFIGSLLFALYPLNLFFEAQLLITTLFMFFVLMGLYFLLDAKTYPEIILSSICFGLSALARPNIMIFFPVILLYLCKRRYFLQSFYFFLFLLITVFPSFMMNYHFGNDICFLSTQGGVNFYAGNSISADGIIPCSPFPEGTKQDWGRYYFYKKQLKDSVWKIDNMWVNSQIIANQTENRILKESEVSGFWIRRTISEILFDPLLFCRRMIKKTVFLMSGYEMPNNTWPRYMIEKYYPVLNVLKKILNFHFLAICFIPGLYIAYKKYPSSYLLMGYLSVMSIGIVAFFVNARFRMPLIPVFILFAAVFIEWVLKSLLIRQKNISYLLIILFCFSGGLLSHAYKLYAPSKNIYASIALFHNALANAHIKNNQLDEALNEVNKAIAYRTNEQFIFFNTCAGIKMNMGDIKGAIDYMEQSTELVAHPVFLFALSKLYFKAGQKNESKNTLQKLLSVMPDHKGALVLLDQIENGSMQLAD